MLYTIFFSLKTKIFHIKKTKIFIIYRGIQRMGWAGLDPI